MRTEARAATIDSSAQASTASLAAQQASAARFPFARLIVFALLAVSGVTWDLYSKWYVFNWLGCPGSTPIWKGPFLGVPVQFDLATTFNHGALWGIGQNQTWVFASLSFVAIAAIAYFLWNRQAIASRWLTVVTGLLLAGTLGNLFDRLGLHRYKDDSGAIVYAVRDFLDFWFFNDSFHWATFNCADIYLVVGACMLVIHSFWVPADAT